MNDGGDFQEVGGALEAFLGGDAGQEPEVVRRAVIEPADEPVFEIGGFGRIRAIARILRGKMDNHFVEALFPELRPFGAENEIDVGREADGVQGGGELFGGPVEPVGIGIGKAADWAQGAGAFMIRQGIAGRAEAAFFAGGGPAGPPYHGLWAMAGVAEGEFVPCAEFGGEVFDGIAAGCAQSKEILHQSDNGLPSRDRRRRHAENAARGADNPAEDIPLA